jgi:hypothetical protein
VPSGHDRQWAARRALCTVSINRLTYRRKTVEAKHPSLQPGTLKPIGGSASDDWNTRIANDTISTLWVKNSDPETRERQISGAIAGLVGISPKDELEGMMAAQLIAPGEDEVLIRIR